MATIKKKCKDGAPFGRPTMFNPEMSKRICDLVATNTWGLPTLCKMYPDLPEPQTINAWRREKPDFSSSYAQAKREQAELLAESIDDIALDLQQHYFTDPITGASKIDAGVVAHARLLIDTRKWTACKLAPKIYGDKKQNNEETNPADTLSKIQNLVADLNKTNVSDI